MGSFLLFLLEKHLFLILSLVFLLVYYLSAHKLPPEALVYPNLIMPLTGLVWLWNFFLVLFEYQSIARSATAPSVDRWAQNVKVTKPKVILFLFVIAYVVLLPVLGFVVTTALFAVAASRFLGGRRMGPLLAFTVVLCVSLYLVFVSWLNVPFPAGLIFLSE